MDQTIAKFCYARKQYFALLTGETSSVSSESINAVFAANLRRRMDAAGMSQASVAAKAKIAQRTVGNYLTPARREAGALGKEPSAKLSEMAMIAAALGVSPWEMLIPAAGATDAGTEQQIMEMSALMREMPETARNALLEQARLVHRIAIASDDTKAAPQAIDKRPELDKLRDGAPIPHHPSLYSATTKRKKGT